MMPNHVRLRRDGTMAWLTLDRPPANSINMQVASAFRSAIAELAADEECRVLMLEGAGRFFSGGGDLAEIFGAENPTAHLHELAETLHAAVEMLAESHLVVVAVVRGIAAGAGFALVLGADLVIATPGSTFLAAYGSVGLTPDTGLSHLLPSLVGQRRANELSYLGRVLDAQTARDWGIVNEVIDDKLILNRALQMAAAIAGSASPATSQTKRLYRAAKSNTLHDQLADEAKTISRMIVLPDAQTKIGSFLERSSYRA